MYSLIQTPRPVPPPGFCVNSALKEPLCCPDDRRIRRITCFSGEDHPRSDHEPAESEPEQEPEPKSEPRPAAAGQQSEARSAAGWRAEARPAGPAERTARPAGR